MEDNDQYSLLNPYAMTWGEKMRLDKWIPPKKDEVQNKTNEMIIQQQSPISTPTALPTATNQYAENVPIENIQNSSVIIPTEISTSNTVNENTDNSQQDITENITQTDPLETDNKKDDKSQEQENSNKKKKIPIHVEYGDRLIRELHLEYFNDDIYFFNATGVHSIVSDRELINAILKQIYPGTEPAICKKVVFYIRNMLYTDEIKQPNKNIVNFKNTYFDLDTQRPIPHTPQIFTLNQLAIDYNPNLPYNEEVEQYLDDIANHVPERKKAILQAIGYFMTAKNNIQKFILVYGPSGSNGKSVLLKIIEEIIGPQNVCHKSIEELEKDFGADGMEFKLLNISTELPLKRIKDISVLKKSVTGDTFETRVKFEKNKTIRSYIKHLFATNFFPNVADDTEGYFRRIHIIPLENQFDTSTSKFNVYKFCSTENLTYLGNRAFAEYLEMANSGVLEFANHEESERKLNEYRAELDTVLTFLTDEENIKTIYNDDIPRDTMYKLYKSFCSINELTPIGKKSFYRELREKYHFEEKIKNNGKQYCFCRERPIRVDTSASAAENNNIKMEGDLNNERYN